MLQLAVAAHVRENRGKGAARKLRKNMQLPAIFYGPATESIMLTVDYPELTRITKQGKGENIILDLQIKSDHGETRKAMLKDLMVDPVNGVYLHADFYEISMDKEITVDIPVTLVNTPIGVTEEGGFLETIRRELTVSCLPDKLIASLEIDVSGLEIGDTIHIRDIELPEGITCLEEGDLTVAVVSAPGGGIEEEEEGLEEGIEEETAESEEETAEESKEEKKGGEQ